ncbi:unnamed protein product, partial [Staurois parvus]
MNKSTPSSLYEPLMYSYMLMHSNAFNSTVNTNHNMQHNFAPSSIT